MNQLYLNDHNPIVAVITGSAQNKSAISVIRISGHKKFGLKNVLNPFFSINLSQIEKNKTCLSYFLDDQTILDQVLLIYFAQPNSFTGEDVFEIHCHGNPIIVTNIIETLVDKTCLRKASAGEFSYRALKNKKLSLNQVEGLELVLNSNSLTIIKEGVNQLKTQLDFELEELLTLYLNFRSAIEIGFDFLDDVGEEQFEKNLNESFVEFKNKCSLLNDRCRFNIKSLLSPSIVLIGAPNSGKSTLFNLLLNKKRAIVSNVAGTTRDYISEEIVIDNNAFTLIDTAGIRTSTKDAIEYEGIELSKQLSQEAFFVISLAQEKDDYLAGPIGANIKIKTHTGSNKVHDNGHNEFKIDLLNSDPGEVRELLYKIINGHYESELSKKPILSERKVDLIKELYTQVIELDLSNINDLAVFAQCVNSIKPLIEELLGVINTDDILDNIFSNFCIGK